MTEWISNSKEVMATISERLHFPFMDGLKIDSEKKEGVLGLPGSPEADNSIFSLNLKKTTLEISSGKNTPTKEKFAD
ncbi:hypothetical protein JTB14_002436 [Gonioctena quinquepunctata]|nr:hypothetical protein JTB14_002436 [Gonioctena quinquepunctata]